MDKKNVWEKYRIYFTPDKICSQNLKKKGFNVYCFLKIPPWLDIPAFVL